MAVPGHVPIPIEQFRGLLILPKKTSVPPEFATAIKNAAFLPGAFLSRPGTTQRIALGGGTDVFHMEIALLSNRYHLVLQNGPALHYSKDYAARTALKTTGLTGVDHFRFDGYGTRTFFTFSDSNLGKLAPFVWTSQGSSDFFDGATEAAPTVGTFAAANSAGAGVVTAGVHKLVVIYETRSGFQTSPSAEISYTAAGSKQVDLTNIPVGGATISKRHIGMTLAAGATFFLLGTISNNVDTTASFNLADATLQQQTLLTDWFQFKHPLPNLMGVIQYRDRMVYWGDSGDASLLWISEKGLPATVRADLGFKSIAKEDGDRITNCMEMGGVLFIFKTRSIYAIVDNGQDPFNWDEPRLICPWAGCLSPSGIAMTSDKQEAFFLDVKGVYRFNGGDPQMISKSIQPYWDEESDPVTPINNPQLDRSECHYDPQKQRVFAWVPVGSDTEPSVLLVGDVREGYDRVKWCPWVTAGTAWRSFAVDSIEVNIAEAGSIVSKLDDTADDDRGSAIDWYYQPGVLEPRGDGINIISGFLARAIGTGTLNLTVYDQDETLLLSPTGFSLSSAPGKDFFRRLNLRKERFFLRVGQNNAAAKATVSGMTVYSYPAGLRNF